MRIMDNGKLMNILGCMIASLALMVTVLNVNNACMLVAHQPELPETAKKLRKF